MSDDFFPQKPELIEKKPPKNISVTVFSLLLFAFSFVLLFKDQLEFVGYLLLVVVIHELGHLVLMKYFGYTNVKMLFIPLLGAFVQGKKDSYSQKQSILVFFAGPIPGVVIGCLLLLVAQNNIEWVWLNRPALFFLLLNIINLLPLDPMDGGQIFKVLVRKGSELYLMIFSLTSSLLIIFFGWYIDQWILIAFGFIMAFKVRALQKRHQMKKELNEEKIDYSVPYKTLSNRDFSKIKDILFNNTPGLQKFLNQLPLDEANQLLANQVNNVLDVAIQKDASTSFKLITILIWIGAVASPLIIAYILGLGNYFDAV